MEATSFSDRSVTGVSQAKGTGEPQLGFQEPKEAKEKFRWKRLLKKSQLTIYQEDGVPPQRRSREPGPRYGAHELQVGLNPVVHAGQTGKLSNADHIGHAGYAGHANNAGHAGHASHEGHVGRAAHVRHTGLAGNADYMGHKT